MCKPIVSLAFAICSISACAGETGNPYVEQVIFDAWSSDSTVADIGTFAGGLNVDEVWLNLATPRFARSASCSTVETFGPLPLGPSDHAVAGVVSQTFTAEPGDYCRMELSFQQTGPNLPAGAPSELEGHSVLVLGQTNNAVPFRLLLDIGVLDLVAPAEITLEENLAPLFISFDIAPWVDGIDFDALAPGQDGVIEVSAASNQPTYVTIQSQFPSGIGLYRDENQNSEVDGDDLLLAVPQ